jgi:hypothetical protein
MILTTTFFDIIVRRLNHAMMQLNAKIRQKLLLNSNFYREN